jgi:hypothetical protein
MSSALSISILWAIFLLGGLGSGRQILKIHTLGARSMNEQCYEETVPSFLGKLEVFTRIILLQVFM